MTWHRAGTPPARAGAGGRRGVRSEGQRRRAETRAGREDRPDQGPNGVLGARANMNHWMGMYPPGWPLLLTPGVWLGVPWMINPVLGGFLVLMTAALAREWFDARTGRMATLAWRQPN